MAKRGLQSPPPIGTRVRLTGYFLKCTGQQRGDEGRKVWKVLGVYGDWAIVDEPWDCGATPAELAADPSLQWRRIALGNLQIVGAPPRAADQPEECPPIKDPLGHYAGKVQP